MTAKGGVAYQVTREQLEEFRRLSPLEKLRWVEELEAFLDRAMTQRSKRIRQLFRCGKL